jgi:hypothetical protein
MWQRKAKQIFPEYEAIEKARREAEQTHIAENEKLRRTWRDESQAASKAIRFGILLLIEKASDKAVPIEKRIMPGLVRVHRAWPLLYGKTKGGDGSSWSQNYSEKAYTYVITENMRAGWTPVVECGVLQDNGLWRLKDTDIHVDLPNATQEFRPTDVVQAISNILRPLGHDLG